MATILNSNGQISSVQKRELTESSDHATGASEARMLSEQLSSPIGKNKKVPRTPIAVSTGAEQGGGATNVAGNAMGAPMLDDSDDLSGKDADQAKSAAFSAIASFFADTGDGSVGALMLGCMRELIKFQQGVVQDGKADRLVKRAQARLESVANYILECKIQDATKKDAEKKFDAQVAGAVVQGCVSALSIASSVASASSKTPKTQEAMRVLAQASQAAAGAAGAGTNAAATKIDADSELYGLRQEKAKGDHGKKIAEEEQKQAEQELGDHKEGYKTLNDQLKNLYQTYAQYMNTQSNFLRG